MEQNKLEQIDRRPDEKNWEKINSDLTTPGKSNFIILAQNKDYFSKSFALPSSSYTKTFFSYIALLILGFAGIYGTSNYLNSLRAHTFDISMSWEQNIPLIPNMIFFYLSVYIFPGFLLFCGKESEIHDFVFLSLKAMFASALIFLLFPTTVAFAWPPQPTEYKFWFDILVALDRPHNLFPSYHICFSYLLIRFLLPKGGPSYKTFFILWYLMVCLSIVLVHQHHVVDILGGHFMGVFFWNYYQKKRRLTVTSSSSI